MDLTPRRLEPHTLSNLPEIISGLRTVVDLAQGTLAWIWARSPRTVPIPGFKTVAQVEKNLVVRERLTVARARYP